MPLGEQMTSVNNTAFHQRDKIVASLPFLDKRYIDYETYINLGNRSLTDMRKAAISCGSDDTISGYCRHLDTEFKKSLLFTNEILSDAECINNVLPIHLLKDREHKALNQLFADHSIRFNLNDSDDLISRDGADITCHSIKKRDEQEITERFRTEILRWRLSDNKEKAILRMLARLQPFIRDRIDPRLFVNRMRQLIVDGKADNGSIDDVYARLLCKPGTKASDGHFQMSPDVFAVKLWVDSAFNEIIPTLYGTKVFIPCGMPTARQLDMLSAKERDVAAEDDQPIFEKAFENLMRYTRGNYRVRESKGVSCCQKTAYCIPYAKLELCDISVLKTTDEWKNFNADLISYLNGALDMQEIMSSYHRYVCYVNDYVKERGIVDEVEERLPVVIEEIVSNAERYTTVFSIITDNNGCIGGYKGQMFLAIGDFRTQLRELSDSDEKISVVKGLSMLKNGTPKTVRRWDLDMTQHIRFSLRCMNDEQKNRYVRALLNVAESDGLYADVYSDILES